MDDTRKITIAGLRLSAENRKELTAALKEVVAFVRASAAQLVRASSRMEARIDRRLSELEKERGDPGPKGDRGDSVKGDQGDPGPKGDSVKGDQGDPGRDGSPDAPRDIVRKLESLEGGDRLDVSAIKGLDERLERHSSASRKVGIISAGVTGRDIIKQYDLSPLLDGVKTSFPIPGNWIVLDVRSSSDPWAFRYGLDYTNDQSSISFTPQVSAQATLAAGQTLYIIYVSA